MAARGQRPGGQAASARRSLVAPGAGLPREPGVSLSKAAVAAPAAARLTPTLALRCSPQEDKGDELLHALGFVLGHEGDQSLSVRLRLSEESQAGHARGLARVRAVGAAIARDNSRWWVLRLSNMSTILREWAAVHAIAHLPLREVLLSAKVRVRCFEPPARASLPAAGKLVSAACWRLAALLAPRATTA